MIKTVLKIEGMACVMCESHINDVIRNSFRISKVSSSYKKGITEIISEDALDEEKLKEAIKNTGYELKEIHSEEYVKKGFSLFK